jgi:hypothetical protein
MHIWTALMRTVLPDTTKTQGCQCARPQPWRPHAHAALCVHHRIAQSTTDKRIDDFYEEIKRNIIAPIFLMPIAPDESSHAMHIQKLKKHHIDTCPALSH